MYIYNTIYNYYIHYFFHPFTPQGRLHKFNLLSATPLHHYI